MSDYKSILIIGASGGLANILIGLISKNYPQAKVIGVDTRDIDLKFDYPNFSFKKMRYTRGTFEKLFREMKFDFIFHLARMSHSKKTSANEIAQRLNLNLMGTSKILELALKHGVRKSVVLSTHHVYGALPDNPVFIKEDSPLKASIKYPELRDVTEMDSLCTNWMWRYRDQMEMIILRPCNIIGPQINNTISQYLRSNLAPSPIDFNPMFQFIHELDMAYTLLYCLGDIPAGVYNVAPDEAISLAEAKKIIGSKPLPFPVFLLTSVATVIKKLWTFPDYLIDYIKFSCVIDGDKLRRYLPKDSFRFTTKEAIKLLKM